MKNISKMDQEPIQKWIKELGTESPDPEFYKSIILKLEDNKLNSKYQPVIPSIIIKSLVLSAAILFSLGLIFLPQEAGSDIWSIVSKIKLSQIQIQMPKIPILKIEPNIILSSSILIFSIMAFISFLVSARNIKY